jgi:hypothetical protein
MTSLLRTLSMFLSIQLVGCTPEEAPTRTDLEIMSVVAEHFAVHADLGQAYEEFKDGMVVVSRSTIATARVSELNRYLSCKYNLAERLDSGMISSLLQRNIQPAPLLRLHPGEKYRLITEDDIKNSQTGEMGDVKTDVALTLPGYSESGERALLYLSIPSSRHGDSAVYVLKENRGKWTVESVNFNFGPISVACPAPVRRSG